MGRIHTSLGRLLALRNGNERQNIVCSKVFHSLHTENIKTVVLACVHDKVRQYADFTEMEVTGLPITDDTSKFALLMLNCSPSGIKLTR